MDYCSRTTCNRITVAIDNFTRKNFKELSGNRRRKCLATGGLTAMHLKRAEAVACFRLTIGYDFLQAFGLASDRICPLCRIANMDGDDLKNHTELIYVPGDITERLGVVWLNSHRRA
ncbi:hypothetical protein CDAR_103582 [Caerostris darwini]|uniref:Uncharacterized protein n=1 Tax=Caerostris darwini TaxID=1538125 RepID=A0AAV4PJQ8_9ARAC|nr:hypothetical protein CDAR_103582 [Caerostris darwini]